MQFDFFQNNKVPADDYGRLFTAIQDYPGLKKLTNKAWVKVKAH